MSIPAEAMKRVGFTVIFFLLSGLALAGDEKSLRSVEDGKSSNTAPDASGAASPEDTSSSLHAMAPSKFFEMDETKSRVKLTEIDHELLSAAIFHETNERRREHGKDSLEYLPRLDEAARMHAKSMAEHQYVAHINPRKEKRRTPADRVREVGLKNLRYVSENVASHFGIQYEPGKPVIPVEREGEREFLYKLGGEPIENHTYRTFAENLVDQWMQSPGHRKNILAEQPEFLGAGCSISREEKMDKLYCVQLFFDRF